METSEENTALMIHFPHRWTETGTGRTGGILQVFEI